MSRSIRVSNGVTNWNVTFDPPGGVQYALATVVDAALVSITGLNTFRCTYSFHFDPTRTQVWQYSVSFTDGGTTNTSLEVPMTGQYSTGAAAATALQDAVNAKEAEQAGGARVSVVVTYSEATKKFTLAWTQLRGTVNSFTIRGTIGGVGTYQRSAMSHYGNQHGADVVTAGANGSVEFAYAVRANRFRMSFAGLAGSNRLSDAVNWEARDILGYSSGMTSDVTIRSSEGDTDVLDPVPPSPPAPADRPAVSEMFRPAPDASRTPNLLGGGICVPKGRFPKIVPFTGERLAQDNEFHRFVNRHFDWGESVGLRRIYGQLDEKQRAQFLRLDPREIRQRIKDGSLISEAEGEWDWLKPEPRSPLGPTDL